MNAPSILSTTGSEAYGYPLLIRHLLVNVADQSDAEIVSGDLRFSYEDPNNAAGIGNEGSKWKFEVKP